MMDLTELKAAAYDTIAQIEALKLRLNRLNELIRVASGKNGGKQEPTPQEKQQCEKSLS